MILDGRQMRRLQSRKLQGGSGLKGKAEHKDIAHLPQNTCVLPIPLSLSTRTKTVLRPNSVLEEPTEPQVGGPRSPGGNDK